MPSVVEQLTAELAEAQVRIADLEAALGMSDNEPGVALRLLPQSGRLLACLLNTPNVTSEMISVRLGIASDARVAVHRLRQELKPYGLTIESRRGLGYWLSPEAKEKVRHITREVTSRRAKPARAA